MGTIPIWVAEEGDEFPFPDIPRKGKPNKEFLSLVEEIEDIYDGLFIVTKKEFTYAGFQDEAKAKDFVNKLRRLASLTKELYGGLYEIEDRVHYEEYRISH